MFAVRFSIVNLTQQNSKKKRKAVQNVFIAVFEPYKRGIRILNFYVKTRISIFFKSRSRHETCLINCFLVLLTAKFSKFCPNTENCLNLEKKASVLQ